MMIFLFLACIGFSIGIMAGLIGIGGALLTVPTLLYIYPSVFPQAPALSMTAITDITAMQSLAAGVSSVRIHWKKNNLIPPLVVSIGLWSMLGGLIGGLTTHWYSNLTLKILFAIMMACVAYMLARKNLSLEEEREIEVTAENAPSSTIPPLPTIAVMEGKQLAISLLSIGTGYLSGILGVGGAIFVLPIFANWLRLPVRLAIGCTTGVTAMTCLASLLGKIQGKEFPLLEAVIISIGALLGANLGAKLSFKVEERWLLLLFLVFVVATLARVSIELLSGH